MPIKFDGKKFADEKEVLLKAKVKKLKNTPKMVSILVGNDKASEIYTNLKQKAAARVGIKFEIKKFQSNIEAEKIIDFIKKLNSDKKINGIMIQLPLPKTLKSKTKSILKTINKNKDVDGLVANS